jgi:hypothetical protein
MIALLLVRRARAASGPRGTNGDERAGKERGSITHVVNHQRKWGGGAEEEGERKGGEERKREKFEDSYLRYSTDAQQNHVLVGHTRSV